MPIRDEQGNMIPQFNVINIIDTQVVFLQRF